jgi:hypothetical protein
VHGHGVAALWFTIQRNQLADQRVVNRPTDPALGLIAAEARD